MKGQLVSVVIPAYNAETTIERCIESVLGDAHKAIEIIVVDDGSTDRTAERTMTLASRHPDAIRLIQQSNRGACAARNAGMDAASGEFIQFLDSDDELVGDKLKMAMLAFQERPELKCVYSNMQVAVDSVPGRGAEADHFNIAALADHRAQHFTCGLNTNMPVWQIRFLRESGLRWNEQLPCWQESVYYVELLTELKSSRQVFHADAVGVRFHRRIGSAGVSSGYWSSRYIRGQLAAVRILYEHCVSKGMPTAALRRQCDGFQRKLLVRSVVGNAPGAWLDVSRAMCSIRPSLPWRILARLPFIAVRGSYLAYRTLRRGIQTSKTSLSTSRSLS